MAQGRYRILQECYRNPVRPFPKVAGSYRNSEGSYRSPDSVAQGKVFVKRAGSRFSLQESCRDNLYRCPVGSCKTLRAFL